jgi:putative FmdB family regulatory protein
MITYEYKCCECKISLEVEQSIKNKPLVTCPECGKQSLERVITGGIAIFVNKDAVTLGQLAERNTKKMGTYELQDKRREHKKSEKSARIRAIEESGGQTLKEESKVTPFYGKTDHEKINKMTPKQVEKFIKEGK